MNKKLSRTTIRIIVPFITLAVVILGTIIAIRIGQGYRPSKDGIKGTGLLAANSFPPGAELYINDKLTSATDDTINLTPGEYQVKINKEGYLPWEKKLRIEAEYVTQTNATLFRSLPSLSPLTLTGIHLVEPSPDGQKIAIISENNTNPNKNGLYILELNNSLPLVTQKEPRLLARSTANIDLKNALLLWSPDSLSLLIHLDDAKGDISNYLVDIDKTSELSLIPDVTARLPVILNQWEEEIFSRETKQFALLPPDLQRIATQSAQNIYFSPKEDKILYTGTGYANLVKQATVTPPATSSQPENRTIENGKIYVYDLKEDKNFLIGSIDLKAEMPKKRLLVQSSPQQSPTSAAKTASNSASISPTPQVSIIDIKDIKITIQNFKTHYSSLNTIGYQWYPNSTHLLVVNDNQIEILEYDSTNHSAVYSGPFEPHFIYPWPDGSRVIVLTNLNPGSDPLPNLYGVEIR